MKKLAFILALLLSLSLCACGQEGQETQDTQEETTAAHAGTRADPYELGDEFTLVTTPYSSDDIVEYTMCFTEFWDHDTVNENYPTYTVKDCIIVRGTFSVSCDTTEDKISMDLNALFITDSMNEESAFIQPYKEDDLSSGNLYNVYDGGNYDVIVMSSDNTSDQDVAYLKVNYRDENGEDASVWISLDQSEAPDTTAATTENTDADAEEQDEQTAPKGDDAASTEGTASTEVQSTMTPEELEAALKEQPMYVESTSYVVQDERYKALYPDFLQAVFKNNSGTDVKNVVVAFAAWDKNGFPVKIVGKYDYNGGYYVQQCNYDDVNMVNGDSYGKNVGLGLDSKTDNISTFKAIVISYEDFDGNTWDNPYYDTWDAMYDNQKLS